MRWLDALLISVHIPAGVIAALAGVGAMLAPKGGAAHLWRGRTYLRALVVVCATGLGLVATRGPHFLHLAPFGIVAAVLGLIGYSVRRRPSAATHLACMGLSYVAVLTAFYVDNGPKLPGWRLLHPLSFWVLPSLVGMPLVALGLVRNARRSRPQEPRGEASAE
jgi:hypothetical protein